MERVKIPNSNLCHCPSSTCGPGHQPMMELIIDILRVGSKNFLGATSIAQNEVAWKTFEGCKGAVMAFSSQFKARRALGYATSENLVKDMIS